MEGQGTMQIEGSFDMTHCLIVDACKAERSRIENMLAAYEFDLDVAEDAEEALEKCHGAMPDMIMVSERLDDMSTFDFIKRVRKSSCNQSPVVLVYTDEADPPRIGRAIWEGASECLMQPFDADILDDKLRQVGIL